ncbi:MAG: hypothetical protein IJS51_07795 [Treponema sp.]|nr:hypothetical protein [Treponema sp.]MBQ7620014.1 hypothetical protein [Treponema sp.]
MLRLGARRKRGRPWNGGRRRKRRLWRNGGRAKISFGHRKRCG